ncbi:NAD-dependent epimerase/dehydratase family protein [Cryobacterium frigoriphilum]|uniref:NAD-dependent epimerase/dehydratase family protein n=1 Tax=Cryobacterium frigoriphilum TaxID=1259150 RepID=A0A4R8ZTI4_9MICO|nr:NAD(P)H-binding protein [Cryobacterium frigoriphilum]TFD44841.1 NAD-dependent epimerase/dehydratase family protein [Cryobacterium frigoriphilum]
MILVTGASGELGRAIVERLVGAGQAVIAATRQPAAGSEQRRVDFDQPDSLDFTGIATVVMVSAGYGEDDVVIARHENVVAAAERDGVQHLIYTSVATDGDHLGFALAHRWTERRLAGSSLRWTILRNGLYAELFGSLLAPSEGVITAPFGSGAVAVVTRADLAEAAANVASEPDRHINRVYDLVGARAITVDQIAEAAGLVYRPDTLGSRRAALEAGGLLPFQPAMLLSIYSCGAHGFLSRTTHDLRDLLGRGPTDPGPAIMERMEQPSAD